MQFKALYNKEVIQSHEGLVGQSKKPKRGRTSPSLLGVQGMCDESLFHYLLVGIIQMIVPCNS
jgi:hypothetical protein